MSGIAFEKRQLQPCGENCNRTVVHTASLKTAGQEMLDTVTQVEETGNVAS